MIKIEAVQPNARELRPISKGWGAIHWWACLPIYILIVGLCVLVLTVAAMRAYDQALANAVVAIMFATVIAWLLSQSVARKAMAAAQRRAPSAALPCDWTFGEEGVGFVSALAASRYDWRAVVAVREEKDRFVLLISPAYNPVLPMRQLNADQIVALKALIADVTVSGRLGRGVD